jgi:hypothetical protein
LDPHHVLKDSFQNETVLTCGREPPPGAGRQNDETPVSTANRGLLWSSRRAASISPPFVMGLIGQMVTVPRAQCGGGGAFLNAFVKVLLIRAAQSTRGFRVVKRAVCANYRYIPLNRRDRSVRRKPRPFKLPVSQP